MPIKFPTMHIAESVVNRILNVSDELAAASAAPPAPPVAPEPVVPDTQLQSEELNAAIASDVPALPGLSDSPDPGATAGGDRLLDTLLEPES